MLVAGSGYPLPGSKSSRTLLLANEPCHSSAGLVSKLKTSAAAMCATHSGTVMKIMNFCFRSCGDRPLISSSEFFYVDDKARCLLLTPSFSRGTIRVLRLSEEQFPTVGSAAPP